MIAVLGGGLEQGFAEWYSQEVVGPRTGSAGGGGDTGSPGCFIRETLQKQCMLIG